MATKPGFQLQYRSRKDLTEDAKTYLAHGGVIVPWLAKLPPVNTDVVVRVVATFDDSLRFEFPARVIQHMAGTGFMATFDDRSAKDGIVAYVDAPAFQEAWAREPGRPNSRLATSFEVEIADARPRRVEAPKSVAPPPPPPPPPLASLEEESTTRAAEAIDDDEDFGLSLPDSDEPDAVAPPVAVATESDASEDEEEADIADDDEYSAVAADEGVDRAADEAPTFNHPGPGQKFMVYVVKYASLLDYIDATPRLREERKFIVPSDESAVAGHPVKVGHVVQLRIVLPARNQFVMFAEAVAIEPKHVVVRANAGDPEFEKACVFSKTLTGKKRLQRETDRDRGPIELLRFLDQRDAEEENAGPIRARIKRMGMEDKINLALSGNREERMALAMDTNKAIPHYVLRNAKITLDEIAFMSRLPNMNPDVLNKIAENTTYVQSQQVVKNLVFNPKTPITTSVRLLDRLPKNELMLLAKRTSMNQRLVQAAKKKLGVK